MTNEPPIQMGGVGIRVQRGHIVAVAKKIINIVAGLFHDERSNSESISKQELDSSIRN